MDVEMITRLADSAADRATRHHNQYQEALIHGDSTKAARLLNDYFYWIGHAVAYRGVVAGLEIGKMVAEDREAEGSCP